MAVAAQTSLRADSRFLRRAAPLHLRGLTFTGGGCCLRRDAFSRRPPAAAESLSLWHAGAAFRAPDVRAFAAAAGRSAAAQRRRGSFFGGDGVVRLPLGVTVALGAPIESAERLRRDVWLNAVAALVLFSASDFAAQHLQHCKAHFGGGGSEGASVSAAASCRCRCCGESAYGASLSATASQLDLARMLAVAVEGVVVNALFLTPLYHKLEAVLAHNEPPGRRPRCARPSDLSAPAGGGDAAAAGEAARRRRSRLLWLLSGYKVLAVQVVAVPVSTLSFLLFTPVLRAAFAPLVADLQGATAQTPAASAFSATTPNWRGAPAPASLAEGIAVGVAAVKRQFADVFLLGCLVWPLSDLFNFRFLPLSLRPVWDSVVDLLWAAYLSFATHDAEHTGCQEEAERKGA